MNAQHQAKRYVLKSDSAIELVIAVPNNVEAFELSFSEPSAKQVKKACRILRELSYDVQRLFPLMPAPSSWVLRCLLISLYREEANASWNQNIGWSLQQLKHASDPRKAQIFKFYELDGQTPLFPNSDNFSLASTHLYASTMLRYLHAKDLYGRDFIQGC